MKVKLIICFLLVIITSSCLLISTAFAAQRTVNLNVNYKLVDFTGAGGSTLFNEIHY